ncbi:hypothetical protein C8R21_1252 [Nitrosospira multiformis]|uniref:Uncharacterized protein n=1 Tax=Nitrosospira multiformis TaxID=1231 RepID=A0A2T5I6V1_9PROT|nr:hypothetical protein C8R21_1252 [Nitrosospira multiformis]
MGQIQLVSPVLPVHCRLLTGIVELGPSNEYDKDGWSLPWKHDGAVQWMADEAT